ncbi:abortive infection system antitoxin AbiGi family protein [Geodermatophilus amargosae]|uniref:abortive infection system antitoxin AbiGi family protein n=1 Tax=Geodermatophilus amargosae TaxID=1296565 RepID=UPI0034DFF50B
MSQFVVHFTKSPNVLAKILATGQLQASGTLFGFSWARNVDEVRSLHRSVCFSEVPLDKIERLTRRHGNYGIAFTKDFLRSKRGARVWYIDQGSNQACKLNEHLRDLVTRRDFANPMWDLTPFMDLVMPGRYEWDWEREWRVRGDLRFDLADVSFVITPEGVGEVPALNGLYMHPKHDLIVAASPQPLVEYVEDLVQQYFLTFENPAESLPVDDGGYVWIVDEWETEQAADETFPELLGSVRDQLVAYLNGISWSWVLSADVASIYE